MTDLEGWRLVVGKDSHGQHQWVYLSPDDPRRAEWKQSKEDEYWLGLETGAPDLPTATTPLEAARNGFEFYKQIQSKDGHWAGAYGGPMFVLPGLIIAMYVTGTSLRPEKKSEMARYLFNKRHPEGGWGLHTASEPTMFGSVMNYVALRLLGVDGDDPAMVEVRGWIHEHGVFNVAPDAVRRTHAILLFSSYRWSPFCAIVGKAWLSILNVYTWEGVNPIQPELWLLPEWIPFHPSRWWAQNRNVYMPFSYLYGIKFQGAVTPLVLAIREEIFNEPYDSIDFASHRNNIHKLDLYHPHHPVGTIANYAARCLEYCSGVLGVVRKKALDYVYKLIVYEDENTGYQCIAPISKSLDMICRYVVEGPDSTAFSQHVSKIDDFLWMSSEGMMMTGTNGSQLWDLAFISQAIVESGLAEEEGNRESCLRALDWLDKSQIRDDPKWYEVAYRHGSKGAWPFSTPEQSYTVSDCTGEGLKAVLALQSLSYTPNSIDIRRLQDSVDLLLTMQNPSGGFASYELVRGSNKLEWLNNSEVFGDTMVEHCYPECTTSAISALLQFSQVYPEYRQDDVALTVKRAVSWLHDIQRPDGSWYGSWGICITYATMFALEALSLSGETYATSKSTRLACDFLLKHQMDDGGWGETYMSCVTEKYCQHDTSQVVQTAWAVIGLIHAQYPIKHVIRRACRLIMHRQQSNGSWLQEDVEGIFNKTCVIDYPNFKFSFTIWALGMAQRYLADTEEL